MNDINERYNKAKTESNYIVLVIEDDESGLPWEGGINGTFYRISRGQPVTVPANLARLIQANARATRLSDIELQEYKNGSGKRLGSGVSA